MSDLIAGKNFPWRYITGFYLRMDSLLPFAKISGDQVGDATFGAYGLAQAELPNPDVEPQQRMVTLPVENKSDYKSLCRAYMDTGVKAGTNELVLLYENRRGLFGRRKASFHVDLPP